MLSIHPETVVHRYYWELKEKLLALLAERVQSFIYYLDNIPPPPPKGKTCLPCGVKGNEELGSEEQKSMKRGDASGSSVYIYSMQ